MLQFVTTLGSVAFATELRTVVISTDADSVALSVTVDSTEALAETYHPDASGTLRVYRLDEVVRAHAASALSTVGITATADGGQTATIEATVIECRVMTAMPAARWMERSFFTGTMSPLKHTARGRTERIWVWDDGSHAPLTLTEWSMAADGTVTVTETSITCPREDDGGGLWSHDYVPGDGTVRALFEQGTRRMQYDIDPRGDRRLTEVRYTNAFGLEDWVAFTGTTETEVDAEMSTGSIAGRLIGYAPRACRLVTLHSGWIAPSERLPYAAMLLSPALAVRMPSGVMIDMVIDDHTVEHDDNDDSMTDYTVTLRPADDMLVVATEAGGIFDATYDDTYN